MPVIRRGRRGPTMAIIIAFEQLLENVLAGTPDRAGQRAITVVMGAIARGELNSILRDIMSGDAGPIAGPRHLSPAEQRQYHAFLRWLITAETTE